MVTKSGIFGPVYRSFSMRSALYLTLATVFWSLNFHLAQIMMQSSSAAEAAFWRYAFAILILLLFVFRSLPNWADIRPVSKGMLLVGAIGLFAFNYCFFKGLEYTSAVNAALIMSLAPALTLLLSALMLGEKIRTFHLWGIGVALLGVLLLLGKGSLVNLAQLTFSIGDLIIFMGSLFFALHNVWIKQYAHRIGMLNFTFLTTLICFLCFALLMPVSGMGKVSNYPLVYWLSTIGIGGLGTALAYYFWNRGINDFGAARGAIFLNGVPLYTSLFAIFFGQSIMGYHLGSGLLIISGLVLMQTQNLKSRSR